MVTRTTMTLSFQSGTPMGMHSCLGVDEGTAAWIRPCAASAGNSVGHPTSLGLLRSVYVFSRSGCDSVGWWHARYNSPFASPFLASDDQLHDVPPTLLQVGGAEIFVAEVPPCTSHRRDVANDCAMNILRLGRHIGEAARPAQRHESCA